MGTASRSAVLEIRLGRTFFFSFCFFRALVSVDISLEDVDIDQCDAPDSAEQQSSEETGDQAKPIHLSTFMGTHRCKKSTKASYTD